MVQEISGGGGDDDDYNVGDVVRGVARRRGQGAGSWGEV